ncbi:hypothetical protein H4R33_003650 [Dimargaris cristalligena]|nr:hypothetical protein H4R33_003650 [Dimargaris cristalligena]
MFLCADVYFGKALRYMTDPSQQMQEPIRWYDVEDYYHYLKFNRTHPIFQKEAWRYSNLNQQSSQKLAKDLPLLSLWDDLADVKQIVTALGILTGHTTLRMMDTVLPLGRRKTRIMMGPYSVLPYEQSPGVSDMRSTLFEPLTYLTIVRLAMPSRFTDLVQFLVSLDLMVKDYYRDIQSHSWTTCSFAALAITLAAMFKQGPCIDSITQFYGINRPYHIHSATAARRLRCNLVDQMRNYHLLQGAGFLSIHWQYSSVASNGTTARAGLTTVPEVHGGHLFFLHILKPIHLSDNNEVGLLTLILESRGGNSGTVPVCLGSSRKGIGLNLFASALEPESFKQLQRLFKHGSSRFMNAQDSEVWLPQLVREMNEAQLIPTE